MTLNSFTDITQRYETTLDTCTCKGFHYYGRCKHVETLRRLYTKVRAEMFAELMQKFDVRSEAQQAARREAYCAMFAIYS